jgi:hypothetical protein
LIGLPFTGFAAFFQVFCRKKQYAVKKAKNPSPHQGLGFFTYQFGMITWL